MRAARGPAGPRGRTTAPAGHAPTGTSSPAGSAAPRGDAAPRAGGPTAGRLSARESGGADPTGAPRRSRGARPATPVRRAAQSRGARRGCRSSRRSRPGSRRPRRLRSRRSRGFPGQWNQPVENARISAAIPTSESTPRSSGVRASLGSGSCMASHVVISSSSSHAPTISSMSHATCRASPSGAVVPRPSSTTASPGCWRTWGVPSTTSVGTAGAPAASQRSRCSVITIESNSRSCASRNSLTRPQSGQLGCE